MRNRVGAMAMNATTPNPFITASMPEYLALDMLVYSAIVTATAMGPVATPPESKAMPIISLSL